MNRNRRTEVRLSDEELAIIEREAAAQSRTVSDLLRRSVLPTSEPPGELLAAAFNAARNGDPMRRWQTYGEFLARAVDTQSLADNPAIVPEAIAGPLVNFVDLARPLVSASNNFGGPAAMPSNRGKTFVRGRVTQRTTVERQATEHTHLSSRNLAATGDEVTKDTYGGTVDVSEQDLDWTPELFDGVLSDLAAGFGEETEAAACEAVEAAVTTNVEELALDADSDAFHTALVAASAGVLGSAKALPSAVLCSVDRWAYVASMMNEVGDPVYPDLRPLRLPLVVSEGFSDGFIAVAAMQYVETFEQRKGLLTVNVPQAQAGLPDGVPPLPPAPGTLAWSMTYRGYFGTNVRPEALVGLAPAESS